MGDLVKVGVLADFPAGHGTAVDLDGVKVAIFRTPGGLVAVSDACVHMGASLADGMLDGNEVECSWHGWRYDVRTGCSSTKDWARLTVYEVKVEGDEVFLRRPDPAPPTKAAEEDWPVWDPEKHLKKR